MTTPSTSAQWPVAGWKLVPVEPDETQIEAMYEAFRKARRGGVGGMTIDAQWRRERAPEIMAYAAMLTASPSPAASPASPSGVLDLYREAVRVDVKMEGPQFMGCNTSALKRAWEADRASLSSDATPAPTSGSEGGERLLRQLRALAVALHEKHYADDGAGWQPLEDAEGILSQIDNMTTGLSRLSLTAERLDAACASYWDGVWNDRDCWTGDEKDRERERMRRATGSILAKPASSPAGGDVREAETKGPYEARLCKGIPTDCCDFGVVSLSEGREVCRAWREQDARAIAAALAKPASSPAGGDVAERHALKTLMKAIQRAEDGAGTLPAKEAVKLRPADWHAVCDQARKLAALSSSAGPAVEPVAYRIDHPQHGQALVSQPLTIADRKHGWTQQALYAHPAPATVESWQDISTAPKDGMAFFGIGPDDAYPQAMRWQAYSADEIEEIGEPGYWSYCEDLIGDVTGSASPLYWRPMFPLPTAALAPATEGRKS
ncbi:hypothetical protein [Bosea minatitlanensis]|uniref:DUF551 domain-containing protein n=1 Tax=Bosea minatitlanensis TaxID=128782 RepID=A0ABW0F2M6_9HYPH|nr:hypothetical protein [Bosea minatitlanensis]MCT4492688.1 hypothetical protein [Bosea minatitlanensis]